MHLPNYYSKTDEYCTSEKEAIYSLFPTAYFYLKLASIFAIANDWAIKGIYDDARWIESSHQIFKALEKAGVKICIEGTDNFKNLEKPVVFVANHMSSMETLVLPSIIHPVKRVLFVMKKELLDFPVFGPVTAAREPIVVGRANPREDLQIVINEGKRKLSEGKSIIIFPQKTRARTFTPKEFNSLGVKLAQRSDVPIVPVALVTDAWLPGKLIKDFGKINPERTVRFSFGEPIEINGKPAEAHQKSIDYIKSKFIEWGKEDLVIED